MILYEHHQSRIVIAALFSQLSDCVLGIRKCRRHIRQIRASRIILDPVLSVYRKEISRHPNDHQSARCVTVVCDVLALLRGRRGAPRLVEREQLGRSSLVHSDPFTQPASFIIVVKIGIRFYKRPHPDAVIGLVSHSLDIGDTAFIKFGIAIRAVVFVVNAMLFRPPIAGFVS